MKKHYEKPLLRLAFYGNFNMLTASTETDDTGDFNKSWLG